MVYDPFVPLFHCFSFVLCQSGKNADSTGNTAVAATVLKAHFLRSVLK